MRRILSRAFPQRGTAEREKNKQVVWQNIILAMGVKIAVMALGAGGVANLWEAVFADVGVALLAILNALRVMRIRPGKSSFI